MQLEIILKPVNEIIPYWRNPRRNDRTVDALTEEIAARGFNVPIVVDKNGVVVKGHARLKAAKRLGLERVPVIVSDAPEDKIKADRYLDNKIQELSSWDFGKLDVEMERLGTGSEQFEHLFRPEPLPEEDVAPQATEYKPVSLGDLGESFGEESDHSEAGYPPADSDVQAAPQPASASAPAPAPAPDAPNAKKRLKTLCPYCGKVVWVEL